MRRPARSKQEHPKRFEAVSWSRIGGVCALIVATLAAYASCFDGEFIWDDSAWTTNLEPLHRNLAGLWQMWSDPVAMQQYYPLTGTSFWIDWNLWKTWTLPYHLENVLLHALSAILFWRLLRQLEIPGAGLASAVFALHPMMVESVAWITERKNVLSLPLFLAALLAYSSSTSFWKDGQAGTSRRRKKWTAALLLFTAALLAKITAFVLPATLLLIAWWKRGRLEWRRDIRPTLPFFALSISLGWLIAWLETHHVGAQGADFDLSFAERCLLAGRAFWFYPAKLLWPFDLRLFYPKWDLDAAVWWQWLFPLTAVAFLLGFWMARNRVGRGPVVAVLFYAGTIFPTLGFMNVYGMFIADVADRWIYVPALGLIALGSAAFIRGLKLFDPHGLMPWLPWVSLPLLAALTLRHAALYASEETFWRAALSHNSEAWIACNNLGGVLARQGKSAEAMAMLERALQLRPEYAEAHTNKGNLLREEGRIDDAISAYHEALRIRPNDYPEAHNNLGLALQQLGRREEAEASFRKATEIQPTYSLAQNNLGNSLLARGAIDEAITRYRTALEIQPSYPDAHNNLGMALLNQGKPSEALHHLERAVSLRPAYAEALNNLGHALLQLGRVQEASSRFREALKVRPDDAQAHHNLALSLYSQGLVKDAIQHYEEAIRRNPQQVGSLNNLAWLLSTSVDASLRDGRKALHLAEQANILTGGADAVVLHTLAAACAEAGQMEEAIRHARASLHQASRQANHALAEAVRDQLSGYEKGQPFREASPQPAH